VTLRTLALVAFALGALVLACQVVAGIERVEKVDPPPVEAGPDTTPPPIPPDPCEHVVLPQEPAMDDPGEDLPDFFLALRTLDLLPEGGAPLPGFDLDGVCTCDTREGALKEGGSSCTLPGKACDLDGGVDNVAAQLIKSLAFTNDVNEAANITPRIQEGRQTILAVISKWNGKANDKEVQFGLVPSDGIRETDPIKRCPGSDETPGGGHYLAKWCGDDPWSIVEGTAIPAGTPLGFAPSVTGNGFVRDYKLVVRLQTGTFRLPFGQASLEIGSPQAIMDLVPLDENMQERDPSVPPTNAQKRFWRIKNGVIAGRLPARDLLAGAGTIPLGDSGSTQHLCKLDFVFNEVKKTVCTSLDIARTAQFDFDPGRQCDALSIAVGFTADPARWSGTFYREPETGNECNPGPDDRPVDAGNDVLYRCDPTP
jgi:hypothetical protein